MSDKDIYFDPTIRLTIRRLHPMLPLGQAFEHRRCGCYVPRGADVLHDARCEARGIAGAIATERGTLPNHIWEQVRVALEATS